MTDVEDRVIEAVEGLLASLRRLAADQEAIDATYRVQGRLRRRDGHIPMIIRSKPGRRMPGEPTHEELIARGTLRGPDEGPVDEPTCPHCGHLQSLHDNDDITDPQGCLVGWEPLHVYSGRRCLCKSIFVGVPTRSRKT